MKAVFLHGLGQDSSAWASVLAALPNASETICLNLFSPELPEAPAYEDVYRSLCARCAEIEGPLLLCGLSLGAVLALHYGIEHPDRVRAAALIAPQYKMPKALLAMQSLAFRLMSERAFRSAGIGKSAMLRLTASMRSLDFSARLGQFPSPTLLLCGEKDYVNHSAAKTLSLLLPFAELEFIPGAGHELNREAPEVLAQKLDLFFRSLS